MKIKETRVFIETKKRSKTFEICCDGFDVKITYDNTGSRKLFTRGKYFRQTFSKPKEM